MDAAIQQEDALLRACGFNSRVDQCLFIFFLILIDATTWEITLISIRYYSVISPNSSFRSVAVRPGTYLHKLWWTVRRMIDVWFCWDVLPSAEATPPRSGVVIRLKGQSSRWIAKGGRVRKNDDFHLQLPIFTPQEKAAMLLLHIVSCCGDNFDWWSSLPALMCEWTPVENARETISIVGPIAGTWRGNWVLNMQLWTWLAKPWNHCFMNHVLCIVRNYKTLMGSCVRRQLFLHTQPKRVQTKTRFHFPRDIRVMAFTGLNSDRGCP